MTCYAVRSKKQREQKNGQCFLSFVLERAVQEAIYIAQRKKQRMYVVIVATPAWLKHLK